MKGMTGIKGLALVTTVLLTFAGCKSTKNLGDCDQALPKLNNQAQERYQEQLFAFTDLSLRAKARFATEGNDQSFAMNIKMKRDSFVWVSVSLIVEAARAYITPDSFTVLDRINKKYVTGAIEDLERFTGQKLSLRQLQDLLVGNPLYAVELYQKASDDLRKDHLKTNQSGITNVLQLSQCHRTYTSAFTTNTGDMSADVQYGGYAYQKKHGHIPTSVSVEAKSQRKTFDFYLTYTSVSTEPIGPLVFRIPSKYQRTK